MNLKIGWPSAIGIVFGVFLYELADTFFFLIQPNGIPTLLRFIGVILIIYNLRGSIFVQLDGAISKVFGFMFFWTLFILFRGNLVGVSLPGESGSIVDVVRDAFLKPYGALAFLLPFIALLKFNPRSLCYINRFSLVLCYSSLIMVFATRD